MAKGKDLFIGIDANAIIHRAFHAYPASLTTSDGVQVNAVYGFTVMLLQVLKQFDPKYVVCAFDTSKPTFRHAKYVEYKAHRKPTDQSLIDQFPIVEEVVKAMNIPILKKDGYEADDILGTISEWVERGKWTNYDTDTYLITGDRDFLQLIGKKVKVCIPQGSFSNLSIFDRNAAFNKYGYYPEQVVEYKAIVGDASDNIPGIKGVGDKTAKDLLDKYGTLGGIYKNLTSLTPRVATLLKEGVEQAEFSKDLATINKSVDLNLQLESCLLSDFDENEVATIFKKLEFRSLITKIPKSANRQSRGEQLGMFGVEVDSESQGFVPVGTPRTVIYGYFPREEVAVEPFWLKCIADKEGNLSTEIIPSFTDDESCETWFYNYEEAVGKGEQVDFAKGKSFFDIKLLSHLLSSGKKSYDLPSIAFEFVAKALPDKLDKGDANKIGKAFIEIVDALKAQMKNTENSEYVEKWFEFLVDRFKSRGLTPYEVVSNFLDIPLARALSRMEKRGVTLRRDRLIEIDKLLSKETVIVTERIYEEIGHEFNVNSPKQLADVLFTELSLPVSGRKRSTREEILNELKSLHPVIELVLRYREVTKIHSTYVKPLMAIESEGEGFVVHTDFKMTGSSSGRFSSINPNMQNIPARGEFASKIRSVFVPRKGFKMVGADYSQIEFRVMADISLDSALVEDFVKGKDIHMSTAARVMGKPEGEITKDERNLGKTINFAILFGQTKYGLSRLAGISGELAQQYIEEYFKTYSGVGNYINRAKEIALKYGYAQSMFGRTRHIAGLSSRNRNMLNAAIREAVNMPIQGGEADIMRLAMVEIDEMIQKKYKDRAYMLLQIHDELIFEVKEELVEEFSEKVKDIMKNVVKLNVPLEVNVSSGSNMSELK